MCDGVGRFQWVATHPEFRRQGLCGTLVYILAAQALAQVGEQAQVKILVMAADPEYVAASIYESIGFSAIEKQFQLEKNYAAAKR